MQLQRPSALAVVMCSISASMTSLLERMGRRLPIIQAPMAGGVDTPRLAAAVSESGGLGSLGCGYLSAKMIEDIAGEVRALTRGPFALNLFIRSDPPDDNEAISRVDHALAPFRNELGLAHPRAAIRALPSVDSQIHAVVRARPAVFSFTFGLPTAKQLDALRAAQIVTIGTATTLEEGRALQSLGVDAICAQGSEAGGHRGTFLGDATDALIGTMTLTRVLVRELTTPIVAAGGMMDGAGIRAALALGAQAVQLGTAFMLCPEAATSAAHRQALLSPAAARTTITRAFSGRAARGIRNRFSDAFINQEPTTFPQHQSLTSEIRVAATAQGRVDLMQLWSGQGAALLREMPAAHLVATLAREAGY